MKDIFLILINKKLEAVKLIVIFVCLLSYDSIRNLSSNLLNDKFGDNNIIYINRICFVILTVVFFVYIRKRFIIFAKKNFESLILLGTTSGQRFSLFLFSNYVIIFLYTYFENIFFYIEGIDIKWAIFITVLNAVIMGLIGIFAGLSLNLKLEILCGCIFAGLSGVLIGLKKLTYDNVYILIMSDGLKQILFSESSRAAIIKFFVCICLGIILVYKLENTGVDAYRLEKRVCRLNIRGDLVHKINKYFSLKNTYMWIYRNRDFVLWKIFSTILFLIVCHFTDNNLTIILVAYGICLVSSFYLNDVYNLQRDYFVIYYMADYGYKKLLWDFAINGLFILGDNLILILFIKFFIFPFNVISLVMCAIMTVMFSVFVNCQLFVKYPLKHHNIYIILTLLKFHVPLLNVYFLYKNIKEGNENWESLKYEHE